MALRRSRLSGQGGLVSPPSSKVRRRPWTPVINPSRQLAAADDASYQQIPRPHQDFYVRYSVFRRPSAAMTIIILYYAIWGSTNVKNTKYKYTIETYNKSVIQLREIKADLYLLNPRWRILAVVFPSFLFWQPRPVNDFRVRSPYAEIEHCAVVAMQPSRDWPCALG